MNATEFSSPLCELDRNSKIQMHSAEVQDNFFKNPVYCNEYGDEIYDNGDFYDATGYYGYEEIYCDNISSTGDEWCFDPMMTMNYNSQYYYPAALCPLPYPKTTIGNYSAIEYQGCVYYYQPPAAHAPPSDDSQQEKETKLPVISRDESQQQDIKHPIIVLSRDDTDYDDDDGDDYDRWNQYDWYGPMSDW